MKPELDGKLTASFLRSGRVVLNASNCAAVITGAGLLLGRPGAGRVWFAVSAVSWLAALYFGLRVAIDEGLFRALVEEPEESGRGLDEWLGSRGLGQPVRARSMEERSRGALRLWMRLLIAVGVQLAAMAAGLLLQAWRPDAG
ncbi:hypothetical protein [Paludibaculum fermentans]|uniref:hypothetical protein n=1 Tax=Paludibaculum fermentans TaxID=1473598 RepID=UPI003EBFB42D